MNIYELELGGKKKRIIVNKENVPPAKLALAVNFEVNTH